MDRADWEKPLLLVLVRTMPEDGVLQLETCKLAQVDGPGPGDCAVGRIANVVGGFEVGNAQNCEALLNS